jgi:hypothetical protein
MYSYWLDVSCLLSETLDRCFVNCHPNSHETDYDLQHSDLLDA